MKEQQQKQPLPPAPSPTSGKHRAPLGDPPSLVACHCMYPQQPLLTASAWGEGLVIAVVVLQALIHQVSKCPPPKKKAGAHKLALSVSVAVTAFTWRQVAACQFCKQWIEMDWQWWQRTRASICRMLLNKQWHLVAGTKESRQAGCELGSPFRVPCFTHRASCLVEGWDI